MRSATGSLAAKHSKRSNSVCLPVRVHCLHRLHSPLPPAFTPSCVSSLPNHPIHPLTWRRQQSRAASLPRSTKPHRPACPVTAPPSPVALACLPIRPCASRRANLYMTAIIRSM